MSFHSAILPNSNILPRVVASRDRRSQCLFRMTLVATNHSVAQEVSVSRPARPCDDALEPAAYILPGRCVHLLARCHRPGRRAHSKSALCGETHRSVPDASLACSQSRTQLASFPGEYTQNFAT